MNSFAVHAHFYQPPREDPLSGHIQIEPSAAPFSNWNEKIHAECYRPNAELQNFGKISFNIGPTLFNWMENYDPDTCQKIIEQDHGNYLQSGCGNALAQAYNHTILPLGSFEDKVTQIYWGIADFSFRFHRKPKGMWLPETAVDLETLEVLARFGIQFTILAPWQADTPSICTNHPYRIKLSRNQDFSVFFYHQELSGMVSFSPEVTINADNFARETLEKQYSLLRNPNSDDQIIVIASDGELYGHHQLQREHFLARLVNGASASIHLKPSNLEKWLKEHPPEEFIVIKDGTSWSCHHGTGRWNGTCPCTPGNRQWKQQFRSAMDHLAETVDTIFLHETRSLVRDPWELRNRYIHSLLGQITFPELLAEVSRKSLTSLEECKIHLLIEAQRERQRMFTSCGWFFDDFDRIEPHNNIAYAAQAVRLVRLATGIDLETQTKTDLHGVTSQGSNLSAAALFERHLRRSEGFHEVRIGYAD